MHGRLCPSAPWCRVSARSRWRQLRVVSVVGPPPPTRGRQRPARRAEIRARAAQRRAAVVAAALLSAAVQLPQKEWCRAPRAYVIRVACLAKLPAPGPGAHAPPPLRTRNRFPSAPLPSARLCLSAARPPSRQMPAKGAIQDQFYLNFNLPRISSTVPVVKKVKWWTMVFPKEKSVKIAVRGETNILDNDLCGFDGAGDARLGWP